MIIKIQHVILDRIVGPMQQNHLRKARFLVILCTFVSIDLHVRVYARGAHLGSNLSLRTPRILVFVSWDNPTSLAIVGAKFNSQYFLILSKERQKFPGNVLGCITFSEHVQGDVF